ncbi:hypothetical protein HKCCE4037_18935 [Rhodobacterales bacterium HKCCE4037]|nr:hypothetical protein [Rhodobacterales bacterium HKCCE4037]
MKLLVGLCAMAGALALAGSYLGALHPVGDSLAVFRIWISGLLIPFALALAMAGSKRWGLVLTAFAAVSLYSSMPRPLVVRHESEFTHQQLIYQKNLLFSLPDPSRILADIAQVSPHYITLQEVSTRNRIAVYDALPDDYARHYCAFGSVGGVAVLARYEVIEGSRFCIEGRGLVGFQVESPSGPLWVVSVHLHWPYPHRQREQIDELLPVISALDGPVLIGGDFNMVPWSWALRAVERASGSTVAAPLAGTIQLFDGLVAPPIDHVLLPTDGGALEVRPRNGSDHRSVIGIFEGAPVQPSPISAASNG